MTNALFLDSAGWFAAMSPRERGHAQAAQAYRGAVARGDALVTSDLVVAEVHALLLRWRDPPTGARFLELVYETSTHTIVHVDDDVIGEALQRWVRRFADQRFTLCDAVSFEVMRRERLTIALTFDRHFLTAGYAIL